MPALVYKRVLQKDTGYDISLIPATDDDAKKLKRLPNDRPVEISLYAERKTESLKQLWSCVEFVYDNHPESYDGYWNSPDELYTWLKFSVGWTQIIGSNDGVFKVPRPTNFKDQKDEIEFEEHFKTPALKKLSDIMGYESAADLSDASLTWGRIRNDRVYK